MKRDQATESSPQRKGIGIFQRPQRIAGFPINLVVVLVIVIALIVLAIIVF